MKDYEDLPVGLRYKVGYAGIGMMRVKLQKRLWFFWETVNERLILPDDPDQLDEEIAYAKEWLLENWQLEFRRRQKINEVLNDVG